MTKTKQMILAVFVACAMAAIALAACSPNQTTRSSETFENDPAESAKNIELSTDPFYVLVIGDDTRIGTVRIEDEAYADGNARSDTMMLARVDPTSYQVTLVTIPRDTQDEVPGRLAKINETYQAGGYNAIVDKGGVPKDAWDAYEEGGVEELIKRIEALTGIEVKYHLDTTFTNFQDIINTMGGLHAYVPIDQNMTDIVSGEKQTFSAGEQDLNGAQALVFARERHKYSSTGNEEAYRQANDRYIASQMVKQILADPATAESLTRRFAEKNIMTDWPVDELVAYAKDFAEHADQVTFLSGTGPFAGDIEPTTQLWMTTRDEETWKEIMAVVDAGGDPNTVLEAPQTM